LEYNDAVAVSDEIKAAADEAIQGIMSGEIDPSAVLNQILFCSRSDLKTGCR
jgi:hypothetical protein